MNTADLISAYLNNEMSPERERQFLVSVASNDQLRLALKSNVMLDRIVLRQAQDLEVPDAVRSKILAQAAVVSVVPGANGDDTLHPNVKIGSASGPVSHALVLVLVAIGTFVGGYGARLAIEQGTAVHDALIRQVRTVDRDIIAEATATGAVAFVDALVLIPTTSGGLNHMVRLAATDASKAGAGRTSLRLSTVSGSPRPNQQRLVRLPDISKTIPASELGNPLDPASDRLIRSKNVASEGETIRNGMPPVPAAVPPAVLLDMSIQHGDGGDNRP